MQIEFDCENCHKEITIDSKQLNTTIQCPHCGVNIELVDDGFLEGEKEVEESVKRIEDILSDMSKRFG